MFSDPQSITLNSVPKTLNRTKIGDENATYRTADADLALRVSHQTSKGRARRMVRVDHTIVAADPITAVNQQVKAGIYVVFDLPSNLSYSNADALLLWNGFVNFLITDTSAAVSKLLAGES